MTGAEFTAALGALRWSQRGVSEYLGCDKTLVRRWADDQADIPQPVGEWLAELSGAVAARPPPTGWKRR